MSSWEQRCLLCMSVCECHGGSARPGAGGRARAHRARPRGAGGSEAAALHSQSWGVGAPGVGSTGSARLSAARARLPVLSPPTVLFLLHLPLCPKSPLHEDTRHPPRGRLGYWALGMLTHLVLWKQGYSGQPLPPPARLQTAGGLGGHPARHSGCAQTVPFLQRATAVSKASTRLALPPTWVSHCGPGPSDPLHFIHPRSRLAVLLEISF